MSQAVAIIGTGQTKCGKRTDVSYPELIYEAVKEAFEDAGVTPNDIEAVVSGSMPPAMEGVQNPHLYWVDAMGAKDKPLIRIATCGSTGISLAHAGFYHVASGLFDLVLVVGAVIPKEPWRRWQTHFSKDHFLPGHREYLPYNPMNGPIVMVWKKIAFAMPLPGYPFETTMMHCITLMHTLKSR